VVSVTILDTRLTFAPRSRAISAVSLDIPIRYARLNRVLCAVSSIMTRACDASIAEDIMRPIGAGLSAVSVMRLVTRLSAANARVMGTRIACAPQLSVPRAVSSVIPPKPTAAIAASTDTPKIAATSVFAIKSAASVTSVVTTLTPARATLVVYTVSAGSVTTPTIRSHVQTRRTMSVMTVVLMVISRPFATASTSTATSVIKGQKIHHLFFMIKNKGCYQITSTPSCTNKSIIVLRKSLRCPRSTK